MLRIEHLPINWKSCWAQNKTPALKFSTGASVNRYIIGLRSGKFFVSSGKAAANAFALPIGYAWDRSTCQDLLLGFTGFNAAINKGNQLLHIVFHGFQIFYITHNFLRVERVAKHEDGVLVKLFNGLL